MAGVSLIAEIEWRSPVGASILTPEIAMAPRAEVELLKVSRAPELETELPPVVDVVDVVEEVPLFEPPDPLPPEPNDPFLEEDPFDELEMDPLTTPLIEEVGVQEEEVQEEEVQEEPVGEDPEVVRELLESPSAVYPESAVLRRLEGTVLLSLTVDQAGEVVAVELIQSSGHGSLDRAAIRAARAYRFEPGEDVLTVSKTITFRLS